MAGWFRSPDGDAMYEAALVSGFYPIRWRYLVRSSQVRGTVLFAAF